MNLLEPAWLLLLLLLPILGAAAWIVARRRRGQWGALVAARLRPALLRIPGPLSRRLALALLLSASAALIAAMARPQVDAGVREEITKGRNLLIALDLSRSMRVRDVSPDRLTQAKVVIYELMDAVPEDRIGLIGFAGTAHLLAPLTIDHTALRETVEQADENWVEMGGSDLSSALRLAMNTLRETGQKNNALVVVSDGDKHDETLNAALEDARRAGLNVLSVGIGTEDGGLVPNPEVPGGHQLGPDGRKVVSRMQSGILRQLASATGGSYAAVVGGADIPDMVRRATADLDAFEMRGRERRVFVEFYQWLVLPAILLLMAAILAATRWRRVSAAAPLAALALLLTNAGTARAGEAADAAALLAKGRHEEARDAFAKLEQTAPTHGRAARFALGQGTAAYGCGDFATARAAFSRALLSDEPAVADAGHFGLGNSLFQIGWQSLTDSPYPTANPPDPEEFAKIVRKRLADLTETPGEPGKPRAVPAEIQQTLTAWMEAIQHYDTALQRTPRPEDPTHNRELTRTFYQKLLEVINEPPPQQKPDGSSEGAPDKPKPDGGEPGPQGSDGNDPQGKPQKPKPDAEGDSPPPSGKPEPKPGDDPQDSEPRAGETPEDAARRVLGESADIQKGPLRRARHLQRTPLKDW